MVSIVLTIAPFLYSLKFVDHLLHQPRFPSVLVQHRCRQQRQRRRLFHRRRFEHRRQRVGRKTPEFAAADAAMLGGEFADVDVVADVVDQLRRRFVHQVSAGQNVQLSQTSCSEKVLLLVLGEASGLLSGPLKNNMLTVSYLI